MSADAGLGPDRAEGTEPDLASVAVGVAGALRSAGITVPVTAVVDYAAALAVVDPSDRSAVYWAGRATLVRRPEDVAAFDAVVGRRPPAHPTRSVEPGPGPGPDLAPQNEEEAAGEAGREAAGRAVGGGARAARLEALRHRDLADCTPEERAEVARAVDRIRWHGPDRRSARTRPLRAGAAFAGAVDGPRTLRATVASGGEPRPVGRRPRTVPRRLVVLLDVSGSMAPYAAPLLRFGHAAVRARRHVEVFTLGTRLTRVTRALSGHDPDRAVAAALREVADLDGGTRLGATLGEFNRRWGAPGAARGAVVLVCSDGWERGDPAPLAAETARLGRLARRLVWANPLRGTPGYEPLARGMAAALPHVDDFVPAHSLAALEELAVLLEAPSTGARR